MQSDQIGLNKIQQQHALSPTYHNGNLSKYSYLCSFLKEENLKKSRHLNKAQNFLDCTKHLMLLQTQIPYFHKTINKNSQAPNGSMFQNISHQKLKPKSLFINKPKIKYIQFLNQSIQLANDFSEEICNQFIHKLSNGEIQIFTKKCLRCVEYFYEGQCITNISRDQEFCCLGAFDESEEQILSKIIAVVNQGGVLLLAQANQGLLPTQIKGTIMTERQKGNFFRRLWTKINYMMPDQMQQIKIEFVPFKSSPYSFKNSVFIEGSYALRIYHSNINHREVCYQTYKGGKLRDLKICIFYHFSMQKVQKMSSSKIYSKLVEKFTNKKPVIHKHYNLSCSKAHLGFPLYDQNEQIEKKVSSLSQNKSSTMTQFKFASYFTVKYLPILKKIEKQFVQKNMRYSMTTRGHSSNKEENHVVFLNHEQLSSVIKQILNNIDLKGEITFNNVTTYILVENGQNFIKESSFIYQKMKEKFQDINQEFYRGTLISSEKKIFASGTGAKKEKIKELVIEAKNIEISRQIFALVYHQLKDRRIKFLQKQRAKSIIAMALNKQEVKIITQNQF